MYKRQPQSVSGSTNYPRAIETGVNFLTDLIADARARGTTRIEARQDAEDEWVAEVQRAHERLLLRRSKGWFTGYNSNVAGHDSGQVRYQAYFGPAPRYAGFLRKAREQGYPQLALD